jgi:hypothetical protein
MHTGLHAIGWGLQRIAIAAGAVALLILLSYVALVVFIVIGQAASSFGE